MPGQIFIECWLVATILPSLAFFFFLLKQNGSWRGVTQHIYLPGHDHKALIPIKECLIQSRVWMNRRSPSHHMGESNGLVRHSNIIESQRIRYHFQTLCPDHQNTFYSTVILILIFNHRPVSAVTQTQIYMA